MQQVGSCAIEKAYILSLTFLTYSNKLKKLKAPIAKKKDNNNNLNILDKELSLLIVPIYNLSTLPIVNKKLNLSVVPPAALVLNKRSFNAVI
jgi:hypothetical protein